MADILSAIQNQSDWLASNERTPKIAQIMTLMECCILSGDTRRPCTLASNREYQSFEKTIC